MNLLAWISGAWKAGTWRPGAWLPKDDATEYTSAPSGAGYVRGTAFGASRPLMIAGSREPAQPTTRSQQTATTRPAETQATRSPSPDSSRPAPTATTRPLQADTPRR